MAILRTIILVSMIIAILSFVSYEEELQEMSARKLIRNIRELFL